MVVVVVVVVVVVLVVVVYTLLLQSVNYCFVFSIQKTVVTRIFHV